jgi:hypothetical protein
MKHFIIYIGLVLTSLHMSILYAEPVVWLKNVEPVMGRGFKALETIIADDKSFKAYLDAKFGAKVGGVSLDYNKKSHKLFVVANVLVAKNRNNRISCRGAVKQLKKSIFTDNPYWVMEDTFPEMDGADRRHFVKIAAEIESYGSINRRTGEMYEITKYSRKIPKQAKLLRATKCSSSLFSEDVFFN